jgi:type I restriction enzyme R subunit
LRLGGASALASCLTTGATFRCAQFARRRRFGIRCANHAIGFATYKVVNLVKSLVQAAEEKSNQEPYLIPIGERAQAIMESFEDGQESSVEALRQLEKLAKERLDAEEEREQTGLDAETFTIYWELKREGIEGAKTLAKNVKAVFDRFPDYRYNAEELRQLKAEIYKQLLSVVDGKQMVALTEKLLNLVRV